MSKISYGAWDTTGKRWKTTVNDIIYVSDLCLVRATCHACNYWREGGEVVARWEPRIIGPDGLPGPLSDENPAFKIYAQLGRVAVYCPVCEHGMSLAHKTIKCINPHCALDGQHFRHPRIELVPVKEAA